MEIGSIAPGQNQQEKVVETCRDLIYAANVVAYGMRGIDFTRGDFDSFRAQFRKTFKLVFGEAMPTEEVTWLHLKAMISCSMAEAFAVLKDTE